MKLTSHFGRRYLSLSPVTEHFSFQSAEAHQQRLEKLRQELDYIKTDAWKYKPIEDLIGF